MSLVRLGGASLLAYLPLLLIGVVLYTRVGVNSQTDGLTALQRIVASGPLFSVTNAVFHLGALLLVPTGVALLFALRGESRDPWLIAGSAFLFLALTVGAGFVFSLGQGLAGVAQAFASAPPDTQPAYAATADMNLRTQQGAELVQSLGLGLWLLAVAVASASAGWPTWITAIGVAGGLGFILAGLSSVLFTVAIIGPILAGLGTLGLVLFMIWDVAVGLRLLTNA
jgi:hypothetical protein